MWKQLSADSAPPVYYSALRLWIASGLGGSDEGLRLFGILVSLGIVASVLISCWMLTGRAPLLATSLIAFNGSIFYYCSSLRAYGLAVLLILPCCAAFWRLARQPSRWNILASAALAILSCHTSYQNSYLLLAIGLAAAGVCAMCRLWRRCLLVLAICFATGLSMLVYLPMIRNYREITRVVQYDVSLAEIGQKFVEAVSLESTPLLVVWVLLAASAMVALIVQVAGRRRMLSKAPSLSLYAAIVVAIAASVGAGFVATNAMEPYVWHFTPFVALAAVMMETVFQSPHRKAWVWLARTTVACIVIAISLPQLWVAAHTRRTNFDVVGAALAEKAGPNDFILVNPCYLAPGFKYYYHGNTEWNTLPLLSTDIKTVLGGYRPIEKLMATPNAIDATLQKVEHTLASGNRLWLVGSVEFLPRGREPPNLPPAPQSKFGWYCLPYLNVWRMQVCYFIQSHARRGDEIDVSVKGPVEGFEDVPLMVVEGWNRGR